MHMGVLRFALHLPFIWLFPSYPVLVSAHRSAGKLHRKTWLGQVHLRVYTSFSTGPGFLRIGFNPANSDLTSSTSPHSPDSLALTLGLTDVLRFWRKNKGNLSLQALLQQEAGQGPMCLWAPVLTSCSILESSQDIKMVICACIWNFWAFSSWTRGLSIKRNQDTYINIHICISLFVRL